LMTSCQIIAGCLSEEEITGLKEMFKNIDKDNSGTITLDELKHGLAKHGPKLSDSEMEQLMEAVSFQSTMHVPLFSKKKKERNFDFSIESEDVANMQTSIPSETFYTQFQADADGNGLIDYDEFVTATVHMNKLDREEHLYTAFQYFDKDNSG
jgi:calcium-dependent protein kinase